MAALGDVRTQDTTATKLVRAVPLALLSGSAIAALRIRLTFQRTSDGALQPQRPFLGSECQASTRGSRSLGA